jgi:hypothetical protein
MRARSAIQAHVFRAWAEGIRETIDYPDYADWTTPTIPWSDRGY